MSWVKGFRARLGLLFGVAALRAVARGACGRTPLLS